MGTAKLDVRPVAGRIGAEIAGVALSSDLGEETVQAILAALHEYKVIFFRDQSQLDDAGQEAFAERLGPPEPHPTIAVRDGTKFMLELDSEHGGRTALWHTDSTFKPAVPSITILRAVVVPAAGGDTMWANTAQAYLDLSPELRTLADSLQAIHANDYYDQGRGRPPRSGAAAIPIVYHTRHPVVSVHPVTGERTLLLGHSAQWIEGLDCVDSRRMIDMFQDEITRPEHVVRWRWRAGDVAIWDNRATQHFAIDDYGAERRVMRRVTIAGDVPVSIEGRRSQPILPVPQPNPAD